MAKQLPPSTGKERKTEIFLIFPPLRTTLMEK
jgi:hypothetical protein